MTKFYSPDEIFAKKDLNGETPGIFCINTNRSAGKTTSMLEIGLLDFKSNGDVFQHYFPDDYELASASKVIHLFRYGYEIASANMIYGEILSRHPEYGKKMTIESRNKGMFYELFLDGESYGYSIPISKPDQMKKFSPLFSECRWCIFDEFVTESGKYLPNEKQKLMSTFVSVSRGRGHQIRRDIKLIMLGNNISMMNPYFTEWKIYQRYRNNTRFIRGDGWVVEIGFNKSASEALESNSVVKALTSANSNALSGKNFLYDDSAFIQKKPDGKAIYFLTILYEGKYYGVRECYEAGYIHISKKADTQYRYTCCIRNSEHTTKTMMLDIFDWAFKRISKWFSAGMIRFEDLECKYMIIELLGINYFK